MNSDQEFVEQDRGVGFRILLAASVVLLIVTSAWLIWRAATASSSTRLSFNEQSSPFFRRTVTPATAQTRARERLDYAWTVPSLPLSRMKNSALQSLGVIQIKVRWCGELSPMIRRSGCLLQRDTEL